MSEALQKRWHWLMASRELYASYQQCLALCLPDDALLLMGQHVWLLSDPRLQAGALTRATKLYALSESVKQAGLAGQVPPFVELVNWNQVLELLEQQYSLQQTWV